MEDLFQVLAERGNSEYGGERVTQLEHALQTAWLAEREEAGPELITASLLHDFGHLVHASPEDGLDDGHEMAGDNLLRKLFSETVTEPIRLHVGAKRYLCCVDSEYFRNLSEPSIASLDLQGGVMTAEGANSFETNRFFRDAVKLRKWDDQAKVPFLKTPGLSDFRGYAELVSL